MSIGDQPAFPHVVSGSMCEPAYFAGMTYRQYLVGQVLGGVASRILTSDGAELLRLVTEKHGVDPNEAIARMTIEMVDATLKKLEAK